MFGGRKSKSKLRMSEGSICSEVSKPMQAGIDSSQDVAMEICEASDSDCCRTKRKRVEKNHVSRMQAGIDSSQDVAMEICEASDSDCCRTKRKRVEKNHVSRMQAGIDSSQDVAMEICEASDSDCCRTKRKRVEKNHVSRVQSQADSSHGQLDGDLETHQVKHKRVKKVSDLELLLNYHGRTRISFELEYAKIALDFYEKRQDAKFEILEVLFSNRATLVVPGFKGVGPWCHVSFIAKPKNSDCCGEHFFGEMVLDHASEKYNVTFCSIFDPDDPGNVLGCVFCPGSEIFLHPPYGCPAGGREIDEFMVQKGTDASQGQMRGCSKRHQEWPLPPLMHPDSCAMYIKRRTAIEFKYAKIALEFYEKDKDAKFEIVEAWQWSKRLVVPGTKSIEEWCHVLFKAKPKNVVDCTKRYFFGELFRDLTTGKYSVTYCRLYKKTNWKVDHDCIICPKKFTHPIEGYCVGRLPYSIEEESYLDNLQLNMNLRIQ